MTDSRLTTCALCGYEFDAAQLTCHASCVFNERCAIICCPNCGYQVPDERRSALADGLRRWLNRRSSGPVPPLEQVCKLSDLHPGQCGQVLRIDTAAHERAEKLHVLGLWPAALVTLQQKRPAFVVRVGFAELSLEREIADQIIVRVQPADGSV